MKKILILEDEAAIREFVVFNLKRYGYTVLEAQNGQEALELVKANPNTDIAILDVMLPDTSGFEIAKHLRATYPQMGIIMLTAKTQETDKVEGFMAGADDYITKPFSPSELIVRVEALYRRLSYGQKNEQPAITSNGFELDATARACTKNGERIILTQVEYAILKLFMKNENVAFSRADILKAVWGKDPSADEKAVDVNIRRLRMKIESDPSSPAFLTTVWGFGYKWVCNE